MDTIRQILDDDANTELSVLHQIDIHLVAHAMKAAIRYSEETLVTYEDYQVLFLNQSMKKPCLDLPLILLLVDHCSPALRTLLVPAQTATFQALFRIFQQSTALSYSISSLSVPM
jgi:hypothetical protein